MTLTDNNMTPINIDDDNYNDNNINDEWRRLAQTPITMTMAAT